MSPIGRRLKVLTKYFFAVLSISITLAAVFPVIFLEGFVGRLFREFGSSSVRLYFRFVSLRSPMLNAYLMKGGEQK
jgi:multidrug efflux pump subunit AcrB